MTDIVEIVKDISQVLADPAGSGLLRLDSIITRLQDPHEGVHYSNSRDLERSLAFLDRLLSRTAFNIELLRENPTSRQKVDRPWSIGRGRNGDSGNAQYFLA